MPELDLNNINDPEEEKEKKDSAEPEEVEKDFEEDNEVLEEVQEEELDQEEGLEGNEPIEIHLGPVTKLVNRTLDQALEMNPDPEFDKQTEQLVDAIAEQHEMYALAKPEIQLLVIYGMRYGPKIIERIFKKFSRKKSSPAVAAAPEQETPNIYNFN